MEWSIKNKIITIDLNKKVDDEKICCMCKKNKPINHEYSEMAIACFELLGLKNVCIHCKRTFEADPATSYRKYIKKDEKYICFLKKEKEHKNRIQKEWEDKFYFYCIDGIEVPIFKLFSKQEQCQVKYVFKKFIKKNHKFIDCDYIEDTYYIEDLYHEMAYYAKDKLPRIGENIFLLKKQVVKMIKKYEELLYYVYDEPTFLKSMMIKDKNFIEYFCVTRLSNMIIRKSK